MGRKQRNGWMLMAIWMGALVIFPAVAARAQDRQQPTPPDPAQQDPAQKPDDTPAPPPPAANKPGAKKNADNATQSAAEQPIYDPLRAEKDLEVGQYYMRKGDVDAAIDRFQDATTAKPGYAIPFRYLGEAQEKKGMKKPAIKSYQRYLDMVPRADDAEKIKKKIERLYKEVEKEKKQI
jgi:tetratricopeptide (TPR) repeat protein